MLCRADLPSRLLSNENTCRSSLLRPTSSISPSATQSISSDAPIEAVIMFGLGSRQKLQLAQQALQEALAQLENTMRERDAYLKQRDIAVGERNEFLRQRDEALAEIERLKRQAVPVS